MKQVGAQRFRVDLFDPMARERALLVSRLTALYGPVTRRLPAVWGAAYHLTNARRTVMMLQSTLGRRLRPSIAQALLPPPALVASFHPLLNHLALDALPATVPLVTVITDWIDFHHAWTDARARCIVCTSQAAFDLCRRRGVPSDRLFTAGPPIHPQFADAIRRFPDRRVARLHLKLRPYAPTILLVGGGDGTEPLGKYARALARAPIDLQVLAVCGRNQDLARRIRRENHAGVHVFGFVQNMPELMLASDLVVTRAGPGVIAEGMACGCPLLLTGYLPGQETGNMREVVRLKAGQYVPRPAHLVEAVRQWAAKPEAERVAERRRIQALADPDAAFRIARLLAQIASS